ncbi:MAG: hypothetical protein AAF384_05480 [Pseudomonadota bacterium]
MLPETPQTIGGVLDAGIKLFRQTFKGVLPVAALFAALMAVLSIATTNNGSYEALLVGDPTGFTPAIFGLFIVNGFIFLLFIIAVAQRQWGLALGRERSLVTDIGRSLQLLIPVAFASIVYYLCMVLGLLLLLVPGLIVAVTMGLFLVVPIVEERVAWFAPFRSHRMVWNGSFWRTAAVMTVLLIVIMAISIAAQLLIGAQQGFAMLTEPAKPSVLAQVLGAALAVLLYPIMTAVMLVTYHDAKLRKEGDDLDSRLAELDAT